MLYDNGLDYKFLILNLHQALFLGIILRFGLFPFMLSSASGRNARIVIFFVFLMNEVSLKSYFLAQHNIYSLASSEKKSEPRAVSRFTEA